MSEFASPRAVFQRLIDGITARRSDDLPRLYAEDAVVVQPFAQPAARLEGRAACASTSPAWRRCRWRWPRATSSSTRPPTRR